MIEGMTEAWCLSKSSRLVGPLEKPVVPEYEEFDIAMGLERVTFTHPESGLDEQFTKLSTIPRKLDNVLGSKVETESIVHRELVGAGSYKSAVGKRRTAGHWLRNWSMERTQSSMRAQLIAFKLRWQVEGIVATS